MRIGTVLLSASATAVAAVALLCSGCGPNQPPSHGKVERAFFCCAKCDSLDGGIYGKGPTQSLRTPEAARCRHEWKPVSRDQFKELAHDNFGVDWAKQDPWWSAEGPVRPQ